MKDKCFLDTNLLVYCIDLADVEKMEFIRKFIIQLSEESDPVISTQSIGEFFNVTTRKLGKSKDQGIALCENLKKLFPVYEISVENVFHALRISRETQYSYWDSLIIAVAADCGCSTVYSEDLADGQIVDGIKIVNPFRCSGKGNPVSGRK